MSTEDRVRDLKRRHAPRLLAIPGVVGVGVERTVGNEYVLVVHLDAERPPAPGALPDQIEGHGIRYVASGPFRAR